MRTKMRKNKRFTDNSAYAEITAMGILFFSFFCRYFLMYSIIHATIHIMMQILCEWMHIGKLSVQSRMAPMRGPKTITNSALNTMCLWNKNKERVAFDFINIFIVVNSSGVQATTLQKVRNVSWFCVSFS